MRSPKKFNMNQRKEKQNIKARSIKTKDFGMIRYRIKNQHIKKRERKLKDKIIKSMRQIWKRKKKTSSNKTYN